MNFASVGGSTSVYVECGAVAGMALSISSEKPLRKWNGIMHRKRDNMYYMHLVLGDEYTSSRHTKDIQA